MGLIQLIYEATKPLKLEIITAYITFAYKIFNIINYIIGAKTKNNNEYFERIHFIRLNSCYDTLI